MLCGGDGGGSLSSDQLQLLKLLSDGSPDGSKNPLMGAWDGGRQVEREREELEEVAGDESKLLKLLSDGSPLLGVREGRRQDGREREEEVARDESRVVRAHLAAMTFDSSTGMYVCMYVQPPVLLAGYIPPAVLSTMLWEMFYDLTEYSSGSELIGGGSGPEESALDNLDFEVHVPV